PLTEKEFNQAISEGKKYLWEIDPTLWKWAGFWGRRKYLKKRIGRIS
ncbi:unnamed protein product, partial [marine sediment metagenome]